MQLTGNDAVKVESRWTGLNNPGMNLSQISGSAENLASMMRSREEFASVTVDGREWAKVLKVGGLARKVVACETRPISGGR